jgi:hypothetical protein
VTKRQAMAEASKRWGTKAAIRSGTCGHYEQRGPHPQRYPACSGQGSPGHVGRCPGDLPLFTVGYIGLGLFFMVQGQGDTWAHAFADVDARAAKERERVQRLIAERDPKPAKISNPVVFPPKKRRAR